MSREAIAQAIAAQDPSALDAALTAYFKRKSVYRLDLSALDLASLPDFFFPLLVKHNVQDLNLRANQLTELPEAFAQAATVGSLNLTDNKLKKLPDVLFAAPSLVLVEGIPGFSRNPQRALLNGFLQATPFLAEDPQLRASLFWNVLRGKNIAAVHTADLLLALQTGFAELIQPAQEELLRRSAGDPLHADAFVCILGNVSFKKTDLKNAVVARGATYQTRPDERTTHFILGRSPERPDPLPAHPLTFVPLTEAEAWIRDNAAPSPLQVHTDDAHLAAQAENINNLLLAPDDASVDMAAALIKVHGVTPGITTGLFALAKLSNNGDHRDMARKLLKKHGSPAVLKALADRGKVAYTGDKAERNTAAAIASLSRLCDEIDWDRIAICARQRYGYGLSYIFRQRGNAALKLQLLTSSVDAKGHLDLHSVISPGYTPDYENAYSYYSSEPFVPEVYDVPGLRSLSLSACLFSHLPPGIERLTELEHLDLSRNMLSKLPDELTQLKKLTSLRLDVNCFPDVPPQLQHLTSLRTLSIQGNRQSSDSHLYVPLTIPPELRAALPQCAFTDGLSAHQQERYRWQQKP